nr:unnamed protein product [Callosobruchus analis]
MKEHLLLAGEQHWKVPFEKDGSRIWGCFQKLRKNARRETGGDLLPDDSSPSHNAHHNPVVPSSHGIRSGGVPVAESDVLSIEEGVSGIFCDSLNLRMNSSFNAFQLGGTPRLSSKRKHIRLKKSMTLPDDTLEHRKRHAKKWLHKVQNLRKVLEGEDSNADMNHRQKKSISPLDAHIKHGGNALNFSLIALQSDSVSSFESDLLTCYDGKILLTRDNDLVKNDIHAVFDIYKPTYRFAEKSSKECMNQTECEFPISMFSDETVIVEVPTRDGIEHEDDDITLLISTCKPRMGVYMIFPILVLLLILLCAFL